MAKVELRIPLLKLFGIQNGSHIGATQAAKMDRRSPYQLTLGAKEVRSRGLQLLSKQFLYEVG